MKSRIEEALRTQSGPSKDNQDTLSIGGIEFDWIEMTVTRMGRDLRLSPKQFFLLGLLMSNPGITFTRERIRTVVWSQPDGDLRAVDATIARLRSAINRHGLPDPIVTVLGYGYKFSHEFHQQHCKWLARGGRLKLRLSTPFQSINSRSDG